MERQAVVVGVGDELLSGLVVNTNAAMAGELFLSAGIRVVRSVCVGDDEAAIAGVLREAAGVAEVVLVTGGLGPTQDDRTREAVAGLLGVELRRDPVVLERLRERFARMRRPMPPANEKQADVPEGAEVVPNAWGTAPGIRARYAGSTIYCIPGVPTEARHLLTEIIIPELAQPGAEVIRTREVRCCGLPESELADRLGELAGAENPKMAYLPGGGEVRLRFVATGSSEEECASALDRAEEVCREALGEIVYGTGSEGLEVAIGRMLTERGESVVTAESCTAGLLAARIAAVPGASRYLRGSVVAYANEVKEGVLGVDRSLLRDHGPVSEEVTGEMARRAREVLGAEHALAITCVAGPDPQNGVEVGTTHLAYAGQAGDPVVRSVRLPGDREQIRLFATTFALNLLRLRLAEGRH